MHAILLKKLRAQKDDPLPTPPVGYDVQWFDRNDKDLAYAAKVTAVQGPGKVELVIFKPRAMPIHKQGVMHKSSDVHKQRNNSTTVRSGSWDYMPLVKQPASHLQPHLKELERRELAILEEERLRRAQDKEKKEIAREIDDDLATVGTTKVATAKK